MRTYTVIAFLPHENCETIALGHIDDSGTAIIEKVKLGRGFNGVFVYHEDGVFRFWSNELIDPKELRPIDRQAIEVELESRDIAAGRRKEWT